MGMGQYYPQGKTALVLAGGGLTGALYEIGALRAMNDCLVAHSVNDFDVFVGTSAGALVAALLANGMSPETMLEATAGERPDLHAISRDDLFHFRRSDLARWGLKLPGAIRAAWRHYLRHLDDMTLFDLVWSLSEALPSGLYDNLALERYVRTVLHEFGGCNDFRELERDLHIIATDLDSGDRAIFGRHMGGDVPISLAVAASGALPVLYKPVRVGEHEYVDGGLRGNASLDVAIEHGATLVICINPLVAFDNSSHEAIPFLGPHAGFLSEKGFTAIASQVARITSYAGLHYHIKQLRRAHPEVDFILIEPNRSDSKMFFSNTMRYSARLSAAEHGFETVTLKLAVEFEHYEHLLERHGIFIRQPLSAVELDEIRRSQYDPAVVHGVVEAHLEYETLDEGTSGVGKLRRTLAELEWTLDKLSDENEGGGTGMLVGVR